jgi:hypothetical protein
MRAWIGFRAVLCAFAAMTLCSLGAESASAQQTGTIQGVVMDVATQRPLIGAQVFIQGTQIGTITNQQGRYTLRNVPVGTHTLGVELIGFSPYTRQER